MKLYAGGHLTFYLPGHKQPLEIFVSEPTPLREILARVGIPLAEVALTALNGEQVEMATALVRDTDVVRIFSSVDGG